MVVLWLVSDWTYASSTWAKSATNAAYSALISAVGGIRFPCGAACLAAARCTWSSRRAPEARTDATWIRDDRPAGSGYVLSMTRGSSSPSHPERRNSRAGR